MKRKQINGANSQYYLLNASNEKKLRKLYQFYIGSEEYGLAWAILRVLGSYSCDLLLDFAFLMKVKYMKYPLELEPANFYGTREKCRPSEAWEFESRCNDALHAITILKYSYEAERKIYSKFIRWKQLDSDVRNNLLYFKMVRSQNKKTFSRYQKFAYKHKCYDALARYYQGQIKAFDDHSIFIKLAKDSRLSIDPFLVRKAIESNDELSIDFAEWIILEYDHNQHKLENFKMFFSEEFLLKNNHRDWLCEIVKKLLNLAEQHRIFWRKEYLPWICDFLIYFSELLDDKSFVKKFIKIIKGGSNIEDSRDEFKRLAIFMHDMSLLEFVVLLNRDSDDTKKDSDVFYGGNGLIELFEKELKA